MPALHHHPAPLTPRSLHHLRLSRRINHPPRRSYASRKKEDPDKPRTLEKPARFNPPSHGSRRVRPRSYPGPRLSDAEATAQKTRRYPNMMPPEGTFMHWFLTNRAIHLWISLGTLTSLAGYTMLHSFLTTTAFRAELPSAGAFIDHPLAALAQALAVYKKHVAHESAKVQAKRQRKVDDARKRREFMREHGVDPGFLTGGWMARFGGEVVEDGERAREELAGRGPGAGGEGKGGFGGDGEDEESHKGQKRRVRRWFGIWE